MNTTSPSENHSRWIKVAIAILAALLVLAGLVILARWLRASGPVADFISTYPGEYHLPEWAPVGFPTWLAWQHFLNAFLLFVLVRSGWLIRTTQRPKMFWTRKNRGLLKTKGQPKKHSINHWLHFSLDWLWVVNGVIFVVLLFVSGQWVRVVPTSWEAIPHAISVGIQYASLDWPTENGWVNYNALQQIAYGVTIFIAAPLAMVSGIRLSPLWRNSWTQLSKIYPIEFARKLHFPVMIYFVLFIIVHVTLVFTTGALRNFNHMYAVRDEVSWVGFWYFAASLVVIVVGWILVRPMIMRPIAEAGGTVSRG